MEVEIVHRPGSAHGNADGLSRQSWDQDESATPGLSAVTPGLGMEGGDVGVATRRKKEKKWKEREEQEEPIYMFVSLVM